MSMDNMQQKDLVLSPNEFAFVLDETKGNVACNVGPHKMSLSQSDKLVRFDSEEKRFVVTNSYRDAIQLFVTAPEGYYIALKNPAPGNKHPQPGTSNSIPENMETGRKINISGPANFALYPGQMAQVIKGHSLRSNQYLLAKVYDADTLNKTKEEREADAEEPLFINGQILIIKGTETTFYIPPNGIEVIPINNNIRKGYAREAVTLERLEYCILKDEDGEKRYVHGPAVVFPKPTESFLKNGESVKYKAIELSDISGVYVKVIADYEDEDGVFHVTGEELFITGKEQMIYYPRQEHTFIKYNDKIVHHAIAIPKGEGRYIMNRMTGEIKTVHGPAMYLPDPRFEVVVKRTLSRKQCELWYPGNEEVLEANGHNTLTMGVDLSSTKDLFGNLGISYATANSITCDSTPTVEYSGDINRNNTFTKPRSISLDSSKYDGAVSVDVWTGYAINIISKGEGRRVVKGPQTIVLDYDQSLEVLELSTGKPKTTDRLEKVAFLKYENNRISDIVNVETADFVNASIKVAYLVDFDENSIDKWFSIDNYVKHLCDWARSRIKHTIKGVSISELYDNTHDIVAKAIGEYSEGSGYHFFNENGMQISDVEVFSLVVNDDEISCMIEENQEEIISKMLHLKKVRANNEAEKELLKLKTEAVSRDTEYEQYKASLAEESKRKALELDVAYNKMVDEENKRAREAAKELENLKNEVAALEEQRLKVKRDAEIEFEKAKAEIQSKREADSAAAMKVMLEAIGPELAASMNNENNQEVICAMAESIAPYAIAEGESTSMAISRLVRGTPMEDIFNKFKGN